MSAGSDAIHELDPRVRSSGALLSTGSDALLLSDSFDASLTFNSRVGVVPSAVRAFNCGVASSVASTCAVKVAPANLEVLPADLSLDSPCWAVVSTCRVEESSSPASSGGQSDLAGAQVSPPPACRFGGPPLFGSNCTRGWFVFAVSTRRLSQLACFAVDLLRRVA